MPERGYWTIEQVSAFIGVPKKTLYKWPAQYPTMPVLATGTGERTTWYFPIERFKKWLRDQEQGKPRARSSLRQIPSSQKSAPVQEPGSA